MEDFETISEYTSDICSEDDYDDMFFRDDFDISVEDDYDVHKELVHFVDKKMSISTIETDKTEKARRFMFAEYLVSYIVFEFHGLVYDTRLKNESEFILYPFYEPLRDAARIIRRQINDANPLSFEIIGDLSKSYKLCYEIFVDAVLGYYSEKGLQAGQFLYFCVYFSELAAKCYRTDFEEVLDFAVYAILDAFCIYKGRKYEFIDFAETLAHKSDQSSDEETMLEMLLYSFEKLKVVNKCDKCEVMNNLRKLSINENIGNYQENGLEECRAALEQLHLVDKCDKYEIKENFEFPMDKIVEKMVNSVEFHLNNCNLPFCSRDRYISLINKVYNLKYKKVPRQPESKFFDDILQEVLTVVNLEASLLSAIYGSSKNQQSLESQDNNHSINTKNKIESSTCSSFQNIQVQNSCLFQEVVQHDCTEKNVETSINASITPNLIIAEREKAVESANPDNTLEHADLKFSIDESNAFVLEQNQFVQRSSDNKVKNLTAEFAMKFSQTDIEKNSEFNDGIVDNNGIKEECNFIEEETKILKEANVIFTPGFKQEDDGKTLQGFDDTQEYGKLNFRNEVKELDTIERPLICENPSENNKLEENFTLVESKNNENADCLFDNNFVLPSGVEGKQIVDFFAIYKSEGEIGEDNLKVLKGDTILFAEDLVRYIVKEFYGISYSETKFDEIRSLSCNNTFDEAVKKLLNFIHDKSETLNRIIFDVLANVKEHNIECYRKYVVTVLSHFVEDGLNSDAFLYFCLHFTELAAKFYKLDHPEMLDGAICSILDAFCLLKDDWSEFKVATERVLEIFKAKIDYQCTGCKIHSVVDNFEKECINTILDTLKTFLDENIKEVVPNNFGTAEDVKNSDLSAKISEKIDKDVKDEFYEAEVITNEKSTQT